MKEMGDFSIDLAVGGGGGGLLDRLGKEFPVLYFLPFIDFSILVLCHVMLLTAHWG